MQCVCDALVSARTSRPSGGKRKAKPDEGEPASERTEVRVLAGPDALYIACRWDYQATPKALLRTVEVAVTNVATGKTTACWPL